VEIIINPVCGAWSPPLSNKGADALRLACTKQKNHGGKHAARIDWDEEADQMFFDFETGEVK
jgi:hypothetical protein